MLKRLLQSSTTNVYWQFCPLSYLNQISQNNLEHSPENIDALTKVDVKPITNANSVLEPLTEDISHVSTFLKPTFNFAAYINRSDTLQELVKLGVHLHNIEKKHSDTVTFILGLRFDDIKEHIIFLNELGLQNQEIGDLITRNPLILKEPLEFLRVRISYLKFKKFTDEMILRILNKNPFWLSYNTKDIDAKLGFFQKEFKLLGEEVRQVTTSKPKLITFDQDKIKLIIFIVKEEMGFTSEEMKDIILKRPSIFTSGGNKLLETFQYLHNTMKIPLERIVETPEILTCRAKRLRERHQFLVKLKKDQFDPKKPKYIGLPTLVKHSDAHFATEIADSSIQTFNMFLKTI